MSSQLGPGDARMPLWLFVGLEILGVGFLVLAVVFERLLGICLSAILILLPLWFRICHLQRCAVRETDPGLAETFD